MAKLIGAQRMVLQAILDLPKDVADNVTDVQIAQATQIALNDVRDWLETLDGDGTINIVRTTAGLSASITAQGKLIIRQSQPFDPPSPGLTATSNPTPGTATPPGTPPVRTILLLASNPKGTLPLRL